MKKYLLGLLVDEFGNVTTDRLPPSDTRRWVIRRKAMIVAALRQGVLTREEACERYNLSLQELQAWEDVLDRHGLRGLRVTRLREYRAVDPQDAVP